VVRDGETLKRIGKMSELFDDHSPLQLQASGVWRGQAFTLVGRLQYKYGEGTWTEWHAVFADGNSAYLSEDNGAYVFAAPVATPSNLPASDAFRVGASTAIEGQPFAVASNQQVMLLAAQGELPHLPQLGQAFAMIELRSHGTGGERVLSIDYGSTPPTCSMGQPVRLEDLQLTGLKSDSVKDEKGRQFNCPNCGAAVVVTLANSQSITCGSCNSLIDVSGGIGGELKHAIQDEPVRPLIALGMTGELQGASWQVVGFQHRMGMDPSDPDEHFGWEEYLLYNVKRGFIFLVDSAEGWSVVKPCTGAPVMSANGQSATYLGASYRLKESYTAETIYALGEFYWRVSRGQKAGNRDFVSGANVLNQEQSPDEVTWSVGSKIDSDKVAKAFKLEGQKDLLTRSDAGPASFNAAMSVRTLILIFVLLLLFAMVISRCSACDPAKENCSQSYSSRSLGGSFGGFSSGGGHK
jgi:ribosomal protein S27AE